MSSVKFEDIVPINLTEDEIKHVIETVLEKFEISKLDNLRNRHPNVQFDCLIRGYIGEYAMLKWLRFSDIIPEATNYFFEGDAVDVDFKYKNQNIELKTSLIPDVDKELRNTIARRDIKLIRRGKESPEELRGDIHLQIYYDQKRKAKDEWLEQQTIDLESSNVDYLYHRILAKAYKRTTYFVGWIDKERLIQNLYKKEESERLWSFRGSKRQFWKCSIADSMKPVELIAYLKNLNEKY